MPDKNIDDILSEENVKSESEKYAATGNMESFVAGVFFAKRAILKAIRHIEHERASKTSSRAPNAPWNPSDGVTGDMEDDR